MAKAFKIDEKLQNFAKSGHTATFQAIHLPKHVLLLFNTIKKDYSQNVEFRFKVTKSRQLY